MSAFGRLPQRHGRAHIGAPGKAGRRDERVVAGVEHQSRHVAHVPQVRFGRATGPVVARIGKAVDGRCESIVVGQEILGAANGLCIRQARELLQRRNKRWNSYPLPHGYEGFLNRTQAIVELRDGRLVLAVDVSPWLRSDAPTSAERLFCHVYGRGKGQAQMIPGWPYSFVAALEPGRTCWTAKHSTCGRTCCGTFPAFFN